ncbi:hypothetical protein AB1Y20_015310 [Prymnesium parvum]|uniref:Uncharacterized protein n=1 Tax=Prymnesium parvum TaxID=97485 RepID=A0AB34JXF4_PRYPA
MGRADGGVETEVELRCDGVCAEDGREPCVKDEGGGGGREAEEASGNTGEGGGGELKGCGGLVSDDGDGELCCEAGGLAKVAREGDDTSLDVGDGGRECEFEAAGADDEDVCSSDDLFSASPMVLIASTSEDEDTTRGIGGEAWEADTEVAGGICGDEPWGDGGDVVRGDGGDVN